ncbi:hypothetical protein TSOC_004533 [Tetrabaena socialis]|uniref:Uncharacterized protein n=1 Tax=Tetrabaena socialis TaxID=47790 RepID=A0A2J8A8M6_9CHLO|nr:hypothetical protein TSOC_004533 [Tetrabaena socialis]|eukprot:PNH08892.1 hypothetical protein TSOC_004533 [Tetrabaena socialis]
MTQPQNCTGWPEPRIWVEAQQWWTDAGADVQSESRHFHLSACTPYNQTLSGMVTIDVLMQLHNNNDHIVKEIYFLSPMPYNASGIVTNTDNHKIGSTGLIDWGCPRPNLTCMQSFRIQVDTSLVPLDCVAPLRLRADTGLAPGVLPDLTVGNGYAYVPELSVKVRFSNGKPACPAREDPDHVPEAPTIAGGFNDFPWSYTRLTILRDVLPTKLLSGNWTIRQLHSFDQRLENRVTPVVAPVTRSFVTLNPRFHVVDPATGKASPMLGSIQLDVPNMIYQNLVIDTTKLPNGRNVLFFRTDAFIKPGTILPDTIPWLPGVRHSFSGGIPHPGGTSSAVLAFAFFVNNPI